MELYGSLSNISGSVTASAFSGSFVGDGGGLYNLPASGVTGLNLSQIASGNATASISSTGFTVNKNTQIQGNLSVTGSVTATNYIVSSSVTYMTTSFASGSTAFGNDGNDLHQFTGSVQITGSISLNGQAIGTGKLDETTFQSYTSSNDGRVLSLETSTGSLNSFTSSINTTIKSKLNSEGVISGSIQVNITGTTGYSTFSSSISTSIGDLSSSISTTTSGLTSNITSLSSSLTSSIGSLSSSIATTTSDMSTSIGSLSSSVTTTTNNLSSSIGSLSSSVAITTNNISSDITNLSSSVATTTLNTKNRVDSIENKTGSYATTGSNLFIGTQTLSGSILPSVDNTYDLGSPTYQWRDVYISSGSLYIDGTKVLSSTAQELTITTDTGQSIKILEGTTDSIILQVADGDIELKSSGDGDILLDPTNGKIMLKGAVEILNGQKIQSSVGGTPVVFANDIVVSGSIDITGTIEGINLTDFSSSVNSRVSSLENSGGSLNSFTSSANNKLNTLESTTSSLNSYTSSNNTKLGIIETTTSSLNTFTSSTNTRLSSIETTTGSLIGVNTTQNGRLDSLETTSGSILTTNTLQSGRLDSIEGKTGSYATTGSNIFQGTQTITGSLYISQDLIIAGSSSIQNISSSQLNIGDNIITVNAINPSVRFGGLSVIDSGSSPLLSGSILFDSVKNEWLFVHQNQGTVTSSVLLMGPETYDNIGNEAYITANRLVKSTGIEHLTNSNISDDGTTVTILSNAVVNGTFSATGTTIVSGSSQITHDSTTGYVANRHIDHTSVSISAGNGLSGGGDISSTRTLTLDTTSATFTSGVKTKMNTDGVVSGSSQISFNGITDKPTLVSGSAQISFNGITDKPTLVSGSSQISYTGLSNIPGGIVSGSAQIDLTSTTNYSSGILTRLNAVGVLSGSAQVIAALPSGTVSGSAQITLTSAQVTTGLGFTPYNATNPNGYISGINSSAVTTALGFTPYNATNPNGYISGINSSAVTTALGFTPYNATNPNGYISGISFANVSSKPTTISGYGITDAITTGNISSQSVSNASTVGGISPIQFFNNMGDSHGTRTSFDASTPSYNFGFRFIQGNTNGPALGGGGQFYSWYLGLGNDYPATGAGSYGMHVAVARGATTPYMSVRYNENNSLGSWIKIAAGYADTAGVLSSMNISQFTNNSGYATLSGSNSFTNSYNEFGDGTGSVSNDGNWNGRLNLAGSSHARLDVTSVSDGIITTMYSHTGQGVGRVGTMSNHPLSLMVNGSGRVSIDTSGHLLPNSNNAHNLGSPSLGWANIYTNDLHLSNMNKSEGNDIDGTNGTWTIQEGAENLYIINNNNGKKFKIDLTEII